MSPFDILAVLVTLAALFSWLNHRFLRLPPTIGLMVIALAMALGLMGLDRAGLHAAGEAERMLRAVDFNETVLHGMLGFLLFAGALHINLEDLAREKGVIVTLASAGVLISTVAVGVGGHLALRALGIDLPLAYALVFGALISPTDPIAVLGMLKTAGVAKSLETKIAGESLFNDGVGVVVFLALLKIAAGGGDVTAGALLLLFVQEAVGGAVFGLLIGLGAYALLRTVDNYQVEVLITLALVTGGYALAHALHLSGPIAMVVAGLFIGNHGRLFAMSERTREHLDTFWELVDEILNAVLFVLIGLEVLVLALTGRYLLAGLALVPVVLAARWVSVGLPVTVMRRFRDFSPRAIRILTWGGLRGGISVALALSLPAGAHREVILSATYVVVVFSIVVQGLTLGRMVRASPA